MDYSGDDFYDDDVTSGILPDDDGPRFFIEDEVLPEGFDDQATEGGIYDEPVDDDPSPYDGTYSED